MSDLIRTEVNDFIPWLRDRLGIEAVDANVLERRNSCFGRDKKGETVKVPYLRINARGESYRKIIESERMGLVNDGYFAKILPLWREYLEAKGADLEEFYDTHMYIGASYYDKLCYADFAYGQKAKVQEYLRNTLGTAPRSVYASSMPGVNVVYETADFERMNLTDSNKYDKIKNGIIAMAREYVEGKFGTVEFHFDAKIWHPKMKGYNGYGLARED